jgi:hypothetical protein
MTPVAARMKPRGQIAMSKGERSPVEKAGSGLPMLRKVF